MLQQLITIARNTFLESIRQPIFMVLLLITALALFFCPSMSMYTLSENNNTLLRDMGLSTLFLAGTVLAAFTAAGAVSREIEDRTVLTVVSKPISRPLFILGKFGGIAWALLLAFGIMTLVLLLVLRHGVIFTARDTFDPPVLTFGFGAAVLALALAAVGNYLFQWVFTSSFVLSLGGMLALAWGLVMFVKKDWSFQPPTAEFAADGALAGGQLLFALLLAFEAILIIAAAALAASTRLGQIMTLALCVGLYILGTFSGSLHARYAGRSIVAQIFYWIIPNMQFLWQAEALSLNHPIPGYHVGYVTAYSALIITAALSLAIALFQTREVG
jgi:ABC-2 type transport system permease protein